MAVEWVSKRKGARRRRRVARRAVGSESAHQSRGGSGGGAATLSAACQRPSARGLPRSPVAGRARYRGARRRLRVARRAAGSASAHRARAALAAARRPCRPRAGGRRQAGCRARGSRAAPLPAGNASPPSVRQSDVPRIGVDVSGSGRGRERLRARWAVEPLGWGPSAGPRVGSGRRGGPGTARRVIGAEPRTWSSPPQK